ncbi:MAG: hypothetical protein GY714_24370 [Desulfobacterales bacterium]|nr:hypothetical protein [Desulfobacterales bacterium]
MKFKSFIVQLMAIIVVSLFYGNTYASDLVGKTQGEFKVTNGSANYNIPIVVPPGIAEMQPKLSINYNSNSGNGILGTGFNLSGLSAISRCGQTYAQDGNKTGVYYTSKDRFMLGGSRLIAIHGEYGAKETKYRTENNQYSKIISYGNQGGGPSYFKVWTKEGMILEFGVSDDSRIEAAGIGANERSVVRTWKLNKISNKFGTLVNYKYFEDREYGENYLIKIEYSNNSVELIYEDRNDTKYFYQAGSKISVNKRLKSIQTKADGILIRDYRLKYSEQSITKTSLLDSLQEFDALDQSVPELKFEWNNNDSKYFDKYTFWNKQNAGLHQKAYVVHKNADGTKTDLIDMNGDGLPDRVDNYHNITGVYDFWVGLNNGTGFDPYVSWNKKNVGIVVKNNIIHYNASGTMSTVIDMNGDGLPDRVGHKDKNGAYGFWVAINNGTGFEPYVSWNKKDAGLENNANIICTNASGTYADLKDINGDGLPDRIDYFDHKKNRKHGFWVGINNGTDFEPYVNWDKKNAGIQSQGYITGSNGSGVHSDLKDMNGDGLPDRIDYKNYKTGEVGFWVGINNGTDFEPYVSWNLKNIGLQLNGYITCKNASGTYADLKDMNGDGLPDRVDYYDYNTNKYGFWVGLNNGKGFEKYTSWDLNKAGLKPNGYITCTNASGEYENLRDINGDGLPDRLAYIDYNRNLHGFWVALNNGSSFEPYISWKLNNSGPHPHAYILCSNASGEYSNLRDMNGDGFLDRADYYNHNTNEYGFGFYVGLNKQQKLLLKSISSSINSKTITKIDIDYKLLSDPTIYTRSANKSEHPIIDIQPKMHVVSSVKIDDSIGGQNTISYKYTGAKAHVKGRGFLGFESIEEKEDRADGTGKTKLTKYNQEFPKIGSVLSEEVRLTNNTLISKTENDYKYINTSGVYSVYKSKSTQTSYNLDGTFLKSVTTENSDFDVYGNIATSKETITGGGLTFIKQISKTFSNTDTDTKWIIGLETGETTTYTYPDLPVKTTVVERTFYPDGALESETKGPGQPLAITKTLLYDKYGNITKETLSDATGNDRSTTYVMDASGQFIEKEINALGHTNTMEYDPRFGEITKLTDANNLVTTFVYDTLGRKIKETRADNTITTWTYDWSDYSLWKVVEQPVGLPSVTKHYDNREREVRVENLGFNGRMIHIDKRYNSLGLHTHNSMPYYSNDPIYWTEFVYDTLDRKIQTKKATLAGDVTTLFEYDGFKETVTNPLGQKKVTIKNALDKIVRIEEEYGSYAEYKYDPLENLIETDVNTIITTISYDSFGNRTGINDPDMGSWQYKYNAFGEMIEQTDAKNQTVKITFDKLGRMVQREENEGISTWVYDTANKGIGQLAEIKRSLEYLKTFSYDSFGRPSETITSFDSQSFSVKTFYDNFSRISKITQPQNFDVEYLYNVNGFLAAIRSPKAQINDYDWKFLKFLLDTAKQSVAEAQASATAAQQKATYYNDKATYYEGLGAATPDMPQELKDELTASSEQLRKAAEVLKEEYNASTKLAEDLKTVSNQLTQQKDIIGQKLANADPYENLSELTEMVNNDDYSYFWIGKDRDSAGRLSEYVYGNGLYTQKIYDGSNGRVKTIKSDYGFNNGYTRSLEYEYDAENNVKARYDYTQDMKESFSFDRMNRLTESNTEGVINSTPYYKKSEYSYDVNGNMASNSNLGVYEYGSGAGPHALTKVGTTGYSYDPNGSLLSGAGKTVAWSSFNKPTKFTKGTHSVEFTYGPEYNRYKKKEVKDTGTTETFYIDKSYEKIVEGNKTTHKYFMYAEGHLATIHVKTEENSTELPDETRYLLYDPLGSVDTITDNRGNIVERMSYEAFGQRREGNWQSAGNVVPAFTNRGYTGHEHIEEMGFIHMNGRVYDPEIGRFLSADPVIQDPYNTQSYNRYSYCFNNPLSYTDPSGYTTLNEYIYQYTDDLSGYGDIQWESAKDNFESGYIIDSAVWTFCAAANKVASYIIPSNDAEMSLFFMGGTLVKGAGQALTGVGHIAKGIFSKCSSKMGGFGSKFSGSKFTDFFTNLIPRRGIRYPSNPRQYSTAFEMKLDTSLLGRSRSVHFNRANEALDNALSADLEFAKIMDNLIPDVRQSIMRKGGRKNPFNWTWEHASSSTAHGQIGIMRLVPSHQHTSGSRWWRILHRDSGASGGYSEWAIPNGAPKN